MNRYFSRATRYIWTRTKRAAKWTWQESKPLIKETAKQLAREKLPDLIDWVVSLF